MISNERSNLQSSYFLCERKLNYLCSCHWWMIEVKELLSKRTNFASKRISKTFGKFFCKLFNEKVALKLQDSKLSVKLMCIMSDKSSKFTHGDDSHIKLLLFSWRFWIWSRTWFPSNGWKVYIWEKNSCFKFCFLKLRRRLSFPDWPNMVKSTFFH